MALLANYVKLDIHFLYDVYYTTKYVDKYLLSDELQLELTKRLTKTVNTLFCLETFDSVEPLHGLKKLLMRSFNDF